MRATETEPIAPGAAAEGALRTLRRGLRLSPELRAGMGLTLLVAVVATAGRVIAPVAVQLTIDQGLLAEGGPRFDRVLTLVALGVAAVAVTGACGGLMQYRLSRASETALSALRVRAFRHVHDLSALHQSGEHRGALVARVTADVNTISHFMEWGGMVLVVAVLQLGLATAVMLLYSPLLTAVVLGLFVPLVLALRWFQRILRRAYDEVRVRLSFLLAALAESVVGAPVIRAYGATARTEERIGSAVTRHFRAAFRAGRLGALMFASGELFAAAAMAGVVVVGVHAGVAGELTPGRLVAFLFLVTLFVGPVQIATEVLDMAQSAIAGWRRVLDLLDTAPDVTDPAGSPGGGRPIPPGPVEVRFAHVWFAYPAAPDTPVLRDVDLLIAPGTRVAVVGETGSGKTTFAKLLTRLMDPAGGRVLLNGVPADEVPFADLRHRVVMVPQDGFL
ncbi:MAG TPA: ABC transporter ATP-binding protein, partial [Egibacteraceae bacterium]|nr:ABC transporter ATP-binding protein [Egibacteraceae bacterium]